MNSNRTVAIVQARMGSSRFPGKMMELLEGAPVMEWVLRRCLRASRLDEVVLATTREGRDDPLATVAERLGVATWRGSEGDVLDRTARAAEASSATTVVRICADRPLVDPDVVDMAVETYFERAPDLAFNHISEGGERWPRGFGAEVLSAELLHWMDRNAREPADREHVTFHAWQHRERYKIVPAKCPPELDPGVPDLRFDIDWPEDLKLLRRLSRGCDMSVGAREIVERWRLEQAA